MRAGKNGREMVQVSRPRLKVMGPRSGPGEVCKGLEQGEKSEDNRVLLLLLFLLLLKAQAAVGCCVHFGVRSRMKCRKDEARTLG